MLFRSVKAEKEALGRKTSKVGVDSGDGMKIERKIVKAKNMLLQLKLDLGRKKNAKMEQIKLLMAEVENLRNANAILKNTSGQETKSPDDEMTSLKQENTTLRNTDAQNSDKALDGRGGSSKNGPSNADRPNKVFAAEGPTVGRGDQDTSRRLSFDFAHQGRLSHQCRHERSSTREPETCGDK